MQMSRSVIVPTTRSFASTTGTQPQPCSHMIRTASARVWLGEHDFAERDLRGELVLYADEGRPASSYQLRTWFQAAQKRACLPVTTGGLHILRHYAEPRHNRHTFCSHLAMRGAPAKAIQELAGHSDLSTTLRYMHLSPAARQGAIELLNDRRPIFGEIVETAGGGASIQPISREIVG